MAERGAEEIAGGEVLLRATTNRKLWRAVIIYVLTGYGT